VPTTRPITVATLGPKEEPLVFEEPLAFMLFNSLSRDLSTSCSISIVPERDLRGVAREEAFRVRPGK